MWDLVFLPGKPAEKRNRIVGGRGMLCQQVKRFPSLFLRHVAAILIRVSFVRTVVTVRIVRIAAGKRNRIPGKPGLSKTLSKTMVGPERRWFLISLVRRFRNPTILSLSDSMAGETRPPTRAPLSLFCRQPEQRLPVPDRWLVNLDSDGSPGGAAALPGKVRRTISYER